MFFDTHPYITMASKVVSPISSGLPPHPTVPSQRSISHWVQPDTTASREEFVDCRVSHALEVVSYSGLSSH